MSTTLNWGILGTGNIAGSFASVMDRAETARLLAIGSRSRDTADAFGDEHGITKRYDDYQAVLDDPDVNAVYIATPHPQHAEWVIRAANAGKHILCEKPMGVYAAEVELMIEAARANDVFLMEAFMYRCSPQTEKVVELVRSGALGEVRMIQATFGIHWPKPFDETDRLLSHELAGGGILDVGCYPISFARLVAGVAQGKAFAEPTDLKALGHLERTGVDGYTAAVLRFDGAAPGSDILAQVACSVQLEQDNVARIYGSEGTLTIPQPWGGAVKGGDTKLLLRRGNTTEEITTRADQPIYALEADTVAAHLARRQAPPMMWADSLGNARALDRWRREAGVRYRFETYAEFPAVRPKVRAKLTGDFEIPRATIPQVKKPVSRLVMGALNDSGLASVLFDAFLEAGGNAFDTSWHYGKTDHVLGAWIESRGVRDEVVILAKGAHTPWCDPANLDKQIRESLEHLRTDHTDLYLMHRDNPDVPVGEFVDVLDAHAKAGRIGAYGGSNWRLERIDAANAYARAHGKQPMTVLSNNFSLARMVNPVWDGCIACSDPESRRWLVERGVANLAWSSQARGFFARGDPQFTKDKLLTHAWYSEDNFERLRRATELGAQKGVTANNIALAYVLAQPFASFALIGPQTLEELRTTLPALRVSLTQEELAWLNLEA